MHMIWIGTLEREFPFHEGTQYWTVSQWSGDIELKADAMLLPFAHSYLKHDIVLILIILPYALDFLKT